MKAAKLLFALAGATLLTSCGNEEKYDFKWVTPTGAPTLAFYDQGENENWVSTDNPSAIIFPSFSANSYDAIVFDGVSGLNLMTKNAKAANYKLVRWINSLGFYVVSKTHTLEETSAWNASWKIDAFVENGNSSRAFLSLAKSVWNWGDVSNQVTFEGGVNQVASNIASGGYDFYVVADPVYTNLKAKMGDKLHLIYDMQKEWGKAHNGSSIPSAALFVNTKLYAKHKNAYDKFIDETDSRLTALVDSPATVKKALEDYSANSKDAIAEGKYVKFGIDTSIVSNLETLQSNNALGFLKKEEVKDNKAVANEFNVALGGDAFADSLFL
jgi:hypothetical protein